ncbi:MAG: copper resistance protein [Sphingomonadales bacterium]|jgi:copper resistance protein B|nr:copper resistance protein [Sphingomonadales bacterium]MEA3049975.1 copper resistance protein [Sphingomonadales bacterium]
MLRLALAAAITAAPAEAPQLPYAPLDPDDTVTAPAAPAAPAAAAEETRNPPWLQYLLLDRMEWAFARGEDGYAWDFSAMVGGKRNRVYLASTGEGAASGRLDYLELESLYSRWVGSDVDLNLGLRWDARPRPNRLYLAAGGQLDTGKLWLGAFGYLSKQGELSARLSGYYNWELAKRLTLQPSFELDAYAQDVPALGLGRGLSYAELGLRLRYEVIDHFAPYVGLSWSRDLGRTARLTRAAGDDPETKSVVAGVHSEF